ncbi:hypothetical protein BGZ95_007509 [Linnemannia exigua]|uniref:Uncharacterized protein n=1 Tax=Linnemannia exigua TaxID=604196 RepID=A0AAD4H8Z2_9FUNG|nr:hypothetical protein BGZ95_007509 [Linnemannia exigua]
MSQGLGKVKENNKDGGSPTGSPSTPKLASKGGWASKMAFLNPKRKPSLPLQSHYLSLPVGGTAATSPTGMYMLHSEDLSVTEFAKLAGITILQEEDDSTTFEESQVNVGDEVHVHRRGSSAELSVATAAATAEGGCGLEYGAAGMLGGSAGNTLNSDRNLTVGSNGSDRGGSRKTNIWDPQFWADPVRDEATSKWLLPSTSTSSLPITSGSGLLAPRTGSVSIGCSAPSSPKLRPQSSLPTSGLSSRALPSAPTRIQTTTGVVRVGPPTTTTVTTVNGAPAQRRRNSCSPAVLMPAAGSRAGSEIDRARHYTSSGVSLKKVDQLPRPPMDAIQLPQDLGRRRSFSSLTAVALELEGGDNGRAGSCTVLDRGIRAQDSFQGEHVLGDLVTATTTTPYLHLEPSTPTTPTKATQTRSPSPSPLSRQIDMGSLESPQEEKSEFFEDKDAGLAYLSPPSAPPASRKEDSAAVLDTAEWIENPMLKPEDNVRVFQRKRSRRILDPNQLPPPPPVSY